MFYFETENVKFGLSDIKVCEDEYKSGNPYNTSITVSVYSHGFYGTSDWTVDFSDFKLFVREFKALYDNLVGEIGLNDRELGSFLKVKCDGCGHFTFCGKLVSETFQKFEFMFTVDQTNLKNFVKQLFQDYGKVSK